MTRQPKRCAWPSDDELMIRYHDEEWGVPVTDDRKHFEYLVLDCFQAGLSWRTILHKRENFRKAFARFDYKKVARFTEADFERLMNDAGIVRNRLKILGTIQNAKQFLAVQKEFGSFNDYIWQFTAEKQINNKIETIKQIQAKSADSDAMSKDLVKRGFKFVGSTICYAYMQAAGMVNDHELGCTRHKDCMKLAKSMKK
ncbi:MAG: DNA-3-methyladenine glycosylase I [bacterium]|nr:DNA-3-methyladenine glycosylase I [bacterium]